MEKFYDRHEAGKATHALREKVYRGHRSFPNLTDKIIILVDDCIATGAMISAAIAALKQ
jgi:putative phosphoribosyl transferase